MLIVIDSSPCSLSLRNRRTTKCHQNKSDLKKCFCTKFFFFQYLLFQSQSCLLESTAAIFRQSAGYVSISSILSIPIMLIGINGGYFRAICRVCFFHFSFNRTVVMGINGGYFPAICRVCLIAASAIPGGYYCAPNFF